TRSGWRARSAGNFPSASCTRFSPNTRWPAISAASTRAALWVFDTATSCTLAGSRPAARAAAATRAWTAASPPATSVSAADKISVMTSTACLASFADFLAPVTVEQFRRDHLDRAPLHLRGTPDKFADVMSWDGLNRLLDMTGIWTSQTLNLALDRQVI